jgi:predicted membrane-bound mannosyltransferase
MQQKLIDFLAEALLRWKGESPEFFKYVNYLSLAITALIGFPAYLEGIGIEVPWPVGKAMLYLGLGAALVSKLTLKNPENLNK